MDTQPLPVMICFDRATVTVGSRTLLSAISFSVNAGDKVALCGPSGSGKSTVLNTLLGIHPLASGSIYFNGLALNPETVKRLRSDCAYIGQEPVLGAETVYDALLLPFQFKAHRQHCPSRQQLLAILEQLRLPAKLMNQPCGSLSGGEKQRIALARGLLLGKKLFLLDEVTSALDYASQQAVLAVCFSPALTVLSVTHDREWLSHCHRVLTLNEGVLIKDSV